MRGRILVNAIKCAHCGALVTSEFRHDFSTHSCAGLGDRWIAADGGRDYLRRVGDPSDWREASTWG